MIPIVAGTAPCLTDEQTSQFQLRNSWNYSKIDNWILNHCWEMQTLKLGRVCWTKEILKKAYFIFNERASYLWLLIIWLCKIFTFSLTVLSTLRAVLRFAGYGMPWVMIVDSKATMGSLFLSAWVTSFEISIIESSIRWKARRLSSPATCLFIPHCARKRWANEALVIFIIIIISSLFPRINKTSDEELMIRRPPKTSWIKRNQLISLKLHAHMVQKQNIFTKPLLASAKKNTH